MSETLDVMSTGGLTSTNIQITLGAKCTHSYKKLVNTCADTSRDAKYDAPLRKRNRDIFQRIAARDWVKVDPYKPQRDLYIVMMSVGGAAACATRSDSRRSRQPERERG